MSDSLAGRVADLPPEDREEFWASLTEEEQAALLYEWEFWARPEQQYPEGDWFVWLLLAGRGYGKTRVGSETVRKWSREVGRIALVGETSADVRDVIVQGESGIMAVSPKDERPEYKPSMRRLTWPNGCIATLYSGVEPDQLRGPQHEKALVDELAKYQYPQETWDNLMLGLRLGSKPQAVVTTTPRPIPIIKTLAAANTTHLTKGTTYDNLDNLAPTFREVVLARYEGTTLGRQELYAEIIEDAEGALWKRANIEEHRTHQPPPMARIVVGVDPPGSATGAECGIVTAGMDDQRPPHYYVLDDRSLQGSPDTWGNEAVTAYRTRSADRIIGEKNFGGDMVQHTIRTVDPDVSYRDVVSSRGKRLRAEPVAALAEQGRLHHVGTFGPLEDELCLAPGTLVELSRGFVSIEDVRAGDFAMTRTGWAEVEWAGQTGISDEFMQVECHYGKLVSTPCHPILLDQEFAPARSALPGHRLAVSPRWASTDLPSLGAVDGGVRCLEATIGMPRGTSFTDACGRPTEDRSHRGDSGISTTSTMTRPTTLSRTSSFSPRPSMSYDTSRGASRPGTPSVVGRTADELGRGSLARSSAGGAGPSSPRPTCGWSSSVVRAVTHHRVTEAIPVFNLKIEPSSPPEFVANGILVHNCSWEDAPGQPSPNRLDAMVFAVTELMNRGGGQSTVTKPKTRIYAG